jgi:hypothetical protein
MNALAILYVNTHLQDLLDEAARQRQGRIYRPSLLERIASAASSALDRFATPIDNRGTMFPALDPSPDRS